MSSRREKKEQARAQRLASEAALRAAAVRRRRLRTAGAALVVVAALAAVGIATAGSGGAGTRSAGGTRPGRASAPATPTGPEGVPVPPGPPLAAAAAAAGGRSVDGIGCLAGEQLLFHIHAHLAVVVNGRPRQIPGGIGILGPRSTATPQGPFVAGGSCFYWLHTHAADGIIHIESPIRRIYTLGAFFDVWGQPLAATRVGPADGRVVAFVNGRRITGDPRAIPLTAHAQIQLDVGRPLIAPEAIAFPPGL